MKNPNPADEKEYQFEFEGVLTTADFYGSDFLPELRRVVESITSWRTNNLGLRFSVNSLCNYPNQSLFRLG
ncbi:MAG: hypothetical protein AABN95_16870 [Acidobacteriota bacterium]